MKAKTTSCPSFCPCSILCRHFYSVAIGKCWINEWKQIQYKAVSEKCQINATDKILWKGRGWIDHIQQGTSGKVEFEPEFERAGSNLKEGEERIAFQKTVYPLTQAALYCHCPSPHLAEKDLSKRLSFEADTCGASGWNEGDSLCPRWVLPGQ